MTTTPAPAPLCFIDTETTGVHPGRRPWEIAIIRRDETGERELLIQVSDVDLSEADPFGLKVGGFYDRHVAYSATSNVDALIVREDEAAAYVEEWTRGAHLVGVVPSFDSETLDPMLRRHRMIPAWHYHLVDVEAMAVGALAACARFPRRFVTGIDPATEDLASIDWASRPVFVHEQEIEGKEFSIGLPWKSDELSRACGVEPPADTERHTALGDARWAMRWYDAIVGTESAL